MPIGWNVGYADHSQARTFRCPWRTDTPMRLTFALLGLELDITLGLAGADDAEPDPPAAEVPTIGGETGTTWLDTGTPDRYMGFTGGWEGDGE